MRAVRDVYRPPNRRDTSHDTHTQRKNPLSWECNIVCVEMSRTEEWGCNFPHLTRPIKANTMIMQQYNCVNWALLTLCDKPCQLLQSWWKLFINMMSQQTEPLTLTSTLHTVCTHDSPLKGVGPRTNGGEIMTRCLGIRTLKEHRRFLTLIGSWPTTGFECCNPFLPSPPLSLDSSDTSIWHSFLAGGGVSSPDIWMRGGDALPVDWKGLPTLGDCLGPLVGVSKWRRMCLWSPSGVLKDMLQPFMRHLYGRSWIKEDGTTNHSQANNSSPLHVLVHVYLLHMASPTLQYTSACFLFS